MKISKLFHWLYATLMFLPIFAVLSACLISTFNMSAKEETDITYKYETNEVNSIDDLIIGNIYHLTFNSNNPNTPERLFVSDYFNLNLSNWENIVSTNTYDVPCFVFTANYVYLYLYTNSTSYFGYRTIDNFECDIVYRGNLNFTKFEYLSICDNVPIESVDTHNVLAQDIFYNSLNMVSTSPLFSWASSSFLITPISYISSLFGMPSTSIVNILLSYWLSISVIWLVFDLVMYVPLLAHKWIDKAKVD